MTGLSEISDDEVIAYAHAIMAAETEDQFVVTFAAFIKDVVAREPSPYEKIASFVHNLLEGQREAFAQWEKSRHGGLV